jgi:hypothetical protein
MRRKGAISLLKMVLCLVSGMVRVAMVLASPEGIQRSTKDYKLTRVYILLARPFQFSTEENISTIGISHVTIILSSDWSL